jgi:NADPH2 dehydrogenase
MAENRIVRIGHLKTTDAFRSHLDGIGVSLPCDDTILKAPESPLADTYDLDGFTIGNRFAVHPMEGWDGDLDGNPTEYTLRRWRNFGLSGAKFVWGGEAVAVRMDGRANPNQLCARDITRDGLGRLLKTLLDAHKEACGTTRDLLVGLQLTHSGRFCRPYDKTGLAPRIAYHHPILDRKFGIDPESPVLSDEEIGEIIRDFHHAAVMARDLGFQFVDIKHCHGYLGHEFLSAHTRPGPYGGSFENRTRFLREIVEGVRRNAPGLMIGVRLSAFDFVPYKPDPDQSEGSKLGPGVPEDFGGCLPYRYGFGVDAGNPVEPDLTETYRFLELLQELEIQLVNVSAGSPYYNPHIQRPALYPPSDGYQPPEDPLVGVARQVSAVRQIKRRFPDLTVVGTAYSYLQEYLPHVAQALVRAGDVDFIGLGRMILSYPDLPLDVLRSGEMTTRKICRTFSDCTTAPRNGIVSGCYPLDPFYKKTPEGDHLREIKRETKI